MEKSIVKSTIEGQEEVWFETEKQAIEFMQSMKNEETYHESEEQIYVEIDDVSYELIKDAVIGVYGISNFGGIEVLGIDGDTVKWRYNFGEPQESQESEIEYCFENEEGEEVDGFFANDTFIEFSEILRVR